MKVWKLLNLGSMLWVLGAGLPAAGEVPAAPAPDTEAMEQEVVPEAALPAAPAEAAAPAEVGEAEGMAEEPAAGEAVAEEPAETSGSADEAALAEEPVTEEAPDPEPGEPAEGQATGEAEAAAPDGVELGAIGYDSDGRMGRVHLVVRGDTLWHISDAYLGTPWVWPSIWQDNQGIENPHLIFPGDRIWITDSEMRKVTPEEAAALLAGRPAPEQAPAAPDLGESAAPEPAVQWVPEEQVRVSVSDREKVGLLSTETVEAAASVLANVAPRLMISEADRIWVGLGEGEAAVGDQLTLFRVQEKVYDPETGRVLGHHVNFLGWVEVVETHPESSLAVVRKSSSEIEVGDRLMPRPPPITEIALQPSPVGVEGQISFLPELRTTMGMLDYVYLNRGTLDGVEVGSPLRVYRKGFPRWDEVRDEKLQVADRVVADLLVVRAQPEASVALVRHTEEELHLGDHFRGIEP